MPSLHHNITGEVTKELLSPGDNLRISSISLCNIHASNACTVDLYIEKRSGGTYYYLKGVTLPLGVTLTQENLSFDNSNDEYGLYIKLTKSASETPSVDVIIN
tara:strand:+ start:725 stop:1033 length:309 start_codon:yes stop_codon:yes gene_type:complete